MPDKFAATWVSHTSINDYLSCPRAYFLKNVYKDPDTSRKVQLMSPPLALGSAVHEVIESLSQLPTEDRFKESLLKKFDLAWKKVSGKRGGFWSDDVEQQYKQIGEQMIRTVMENPGPVGRKSVKIKADLPQFWLSEEDEIILCGKIDWLEYLPEDDSVRIIDFKTGKSSESDESLQLPIYSLLVHNVQRRKVAGASYWYLRNSAELEEKKLPDLQQAHEDVLKVAKKIKTARKLGHFKCSGGEQGCWACRPMEAVVSGEAQLVGVNDYNQNIYILEKSSSLIEDESVIL